MDSNTSWIESKKKHILVGLATVVIITLLIVIILVSAIGKPHPETVWTVYPQYDDNRIIYEKSNRSIHGTNVIAASIHKVFNEYRKKELQFADKLVNCTNTTLLPEDEDLACWFDVDEIEDALPEDFGYHEGTPAVILQLNPPKGWMPYKEDNVQAYVPVICKGDEKLDDSDAGEINIIPSEGIPTKYFPYRGQEAYLAPMVAIQFMNPKDDVVISVTCSLSYPGLSGDDVYRFKIDFALDVLNKALYA